MSPEEIEERVNNILWGAKHAFVKDGCGNERLVIFKQPNISQKNFIDFIYKKTYNECVSNGIVTMRELHGILNERKLWTGEDNEELEKLTEGVDTLEREISKLKGTKKRRVSQILKWNKSKVEQLEKKRGELLWCAAENYTGEIRTFALVFCMSYSELEKPLWQTWSDFLNETDITFIYNLIGSLSTIEVYPIKEIRAVARSPQWRFRWNGGKSLGNLFSKSIADFDVNQQNLLYWSQIYDSVYEAYEPPSQEIIDDDNALDKWLDERDKKDKKKKIEATGRSGNINIGDKVRRHGEIFIVTNPEINPSSPTREEVDSLNLESVVKFKNKELDRIKEKGVLYEKDLRSRKNKSARRLIGASDAVLVRKAGGKMQVDKKMMGGTI